MHRSAFSMVALAALLAGCASHSRNTDTIGPGSPSASRDGDGQGGRGRGGPGGPGGQARMDEMLFRGITLSDDQRRQVDAIRTRYRAQADQLRQQNGGDRTANRDAMRSMMEHQQAEIRAVLTADQQRTYDQNMADVRARMQQGGARPGGAPPQG